MGHKQGYIFLQDLQFPSSGIFCKYNKLPILIILGKYYWGSNKAVFPKKCIENLKIDYRTIYRLKIIENPDLNNVKH